MDRVKLSKTMSYILRHHPGKFGLNINPDGTVNLENFIKKLGKRFGSLNKEDVMDVVKSDSKKRFSIINEKYIRANYGHSLDGVHPDYSEVEPPLSLYHGTARRNLSSIKNKGLISKNRNFVHLSKTRDEAEKVGKRHDNSPIILEIKSKKAYKKGIKFYDAGTVYLAKKIAPRYINFNNIK